MDLPVLGTTVELLSAACAGCCGSAAAAAVARWPPQMGRGAGKGDGKGGDCSDFSLIGEAGALVQGLCVLIIVFIIGGPVMIGYAITFFGKASTDSRDLLISQLKVNVDEWQATERAKFMGVSYTAQIPAQPGVSCGVDGAVTCTQQGPWRLQALVTGDLVSDLGMVEDDKVKR